MNFLGRQSQHQAFRLTKVPPARKLWRTTIVCWTIAVLGAANVIASECVTDGTFDHPAKGLLMGVFGTSPSAFAITTRVSQFFMVAAMVFATLGLFVAAPCGFVTLIAAIAVTLHESWGPPPDNTQ